MTKNIQSWVAVLLIGYALGTMPANAQDADKPDLLVGTPTVTDAGPGPSGLFQLSARVSNSGTADSPTTTLRVYRSTDSTITTSDTELTTTQIGELAASGGSVTQVTFALIAPSTAGTYYYGACVDSVTNESDTTNNCSASVTVVVSSQAPDLEVGTPTVSNANPTPSISFMLSATVSNSGTGGAASTTLRYYRSTDATITTSDTQVGTDAVEALVASGTSAESISLTAPSTAGTYYYGACVDAVTDESDTTDNCSESVSVVVSTSPDLVVGTPTVDDAGPAPGGSLMLSATVLNTGAGASQATTLRYYRSIDATITTSDTSVGTDAVGMLASFGTSDETISLTASSLPGTYYYGACVDTVTGETDMTDNCSASVKVVVSAHPPDLEVGTPTISDAEARTLGAFRLSASVSNKGNGGSVATTLHWYRSTDTTITTADTQVGTNAVGALAGSGTSGESIWLNAPSTTGTYYYGACVDSVTDETDTTDNCSGSVSVVVLPQDLEVRSSRVDDTTPAPNATFILFATVRNSGWVTAAATTLRWYRSTDATITTADTQVGTDAVRAIAGSGSDIQSISLTAPSTAGTYYYGACVDAVTDESDTTDNCSASVKVVVSAQPPDLEVGTPTISDAEARTLGAFRLSASVSNKGNGGSVATTLRWYRSTDTTITTADTQVGTNAVGALAGSGTSGESIWLNAPSTTGTYYYGACVDSVTDETDTTDNCSGSVSVVVLPQDLEVRSSRVDDTTPAPNATFILFATVRNSGWVTAAATTLRWYRSTDATITTADTQVGTDAVRAIAGSGSDIQSISLTAPSTAGTYYYGACVDAVTDESDTTDNCSASVTVTVTVTVVDLTPSFGTATVSDQSYTTGTAITALTLPGATGGDGDLVYSLTPALPAGLELNTGTRMLTGTPTSTQNSTQYTWTATDEDGDKVELTFAIAVTNNNVRRSNGQQAVKNLLAKLAQEAMSGTMSNVGARFGDIGASGLMLDGQTELLESAAIQGSVDRVCTASHFGQGDFRTHTSCASGAWSRGLWEDELRMSGFSMHLGKAEAKDSVADPRTPLWSMWGRGDFGSFAGRGTPSMNYDGELRTGWLGMDVRTESWVAGLAVSQGEGEADYGFTEEGLSGQGRLETTLTAFYPYGRWTLSDGLELRGVLGVGTGEARHDSGNGEVGTGGLKMRMASLGMQRALPEFAGMALAVRADASLTRLDTGNGPDAIHGLSADSWRLRAGMEASRRVVIASGRELEPFIEATVRQDGGDGLEGSGVELAGGVRYSVPGMVLEARGRWLAAHSEAGAEEKGVSLTARAGPGADGRGLWISLTPRWGARSDSASALWGNEMPEPSASGDGGVIGAKLGYGIFLPDAGGLLTPYAEADIAGSDNRRLRLGARYAALRADFRVELAGEREESETAGSEHALKLNLQLKF